MGTAIDLPSALAWDIPPCFWMFSLRETTRLKVCDTSLDFSSQHSWRVLGKVSRAGHSPQLLRQSGTVLWPQNCRLCPITVFWRVTEASICGRNVKKGCGAQLWKSGLRTWVPAHNLYRDRQTKDYNTVHCTVSTSHKINYYIIFAVGCILFKHHWII